MGATPAVRVWVFSTSLVALGGFLVLHASQLDAPSGHKFQMPWWLLAGAFVLTERFVVDLDVRKQAQTLAFTEAPLTLGLVLATPTDVIAVRIAVGIGAIVIFRRSAAVKVVFNAGLFAVQASVALFVFHAVLASASPIEPRGWLAGLLSAAAFFLTSALLVTIVMRLAGVEVTLKSQMLVIAVGLAAALAGAAAALAAAATLWSDGRSWILLLIIGAAVGYFGLSYLKIRERHRSLALLNSYTTALSTGSNVDDLIRSVLSGLIELMHASRVALLLPERGHVLCHELADGKPSTSSSYVSAGEWQTALFLADRKVLGWPPGMTVLGVELSDTDTIVHPLPLSGDRGLLVVDGRQSEARLFDAEDLQLLETAAGHAASAVDNALLMERLREEASFRAHQALHDDVTDLPNQRSLVEQLQGQFALGTRLVMLTVRIHSLREVNETLGRAVGDEMLRQVAARLPAIGAGSPCARSGTDEFTLVVPGGQAEADDVAQRIVEVFEQPVLCNGVGLAVTVGVGVALAPAHGTEPEILLRRASLAASRSALDGTTVTTWAADRDPYDPQRLTIAADLRDAIPRGELEVHFQPQLDMATGRVTGAEALVRWHHPRLGHLRPDQFILAAEHTGAIDALTFHVLTVSAETGARWHRRGWDLDVGVNLSARNLTSPNFAEHVADILARTGFPAGSLTLELTESSVMTEAERALTTLHELHALGINLSIDDFGTGYSSLAHLRRLPVGEIKIDKSFVFDLTTSESDEAIVRSMIELGHNLGLTVVAEGVETVEVRDRLADLDCNRMQGYLLSRPLPAAAFEHWMAERPRAQRGERRGRPGQVVSLDLRR
jgi:diguanylate cyclase (GGDEF)-like protein